MEKIDTNFKRKPNGDLYLNDVVLEVVNKLNEAIEVINDLKAQKRRNKNIGR